MKLRSNNLALALAVLPFLVAACGINESARPKRRKTGDDAAKDGNRAREEVQIKNNSETQDRVNADDFSAAELQDLSAVEGFSYRYEGRVNGKSIRFLKTETTEAGSMKAAIFNAWKGGITSKKVVKWLSGSLAKPVQLIAKQSFNADSRQVLFQLEKQDPADSGLAASVFSGGSASHKQDFNRRINAAQCAAGLLCVDHQTDQPSSGTAKSFCYYDRASGKKTVVPVGPLPNASAEQLVDAYKQYPVYVAFITEDSSAACAPTLGEMRMQARGSLQYFQITVQRVEDVDAANAERPHKKNNLALQIGVRFRLSLLRDDDVRPYAQEKLRLSQDTTYFLNTDAGVMPRFITTVHRSLNDSVSFTLALIPGIRDMISHDGVRANYDFELCQDEEAAAVAACR